MPTTLPAIIIYVPPSHISKCSFYKLLWLLNQWTIVTLPESRLGIHGTDGKKNKFLMYNYYWGCDMYILYRNIQTKIVPSRTLLKRLRSHNTDLRRLICCIRKCLLTLTLIHSDFPADFSSVTLTPCCGSALCTPIGTRPPLVVVCRILFKLIRNLSCRKHSWNTRCLTRHWVMRFGIMQLSL